MKRIAYKPFEYPEYYTEGWLKQAQAFLAYTLRYQCKVMLKTGTRKLDKKEKTLSW